MTSYGGTFLLSLIQRHALARAANSTKCPVCGTGCGDRTFQAKSRLIVTCGDCRLQFADPLTSEAAEAALEKLGEAFVETYIREEPSYRAYFRRKASDLLKVMSQGRLLDVGCATGVFLDEARRAGFQGTGLDLMPSAVDYARNRLGVDVRLGLLKEMRFAGEQFDVVTLFQIIEHVADPVGLVTEAARVLKPGGILVVTTPDRHGLFSRVLGRRWFEYYNEEHLTYFNDQSLRRLLADARFTVLSLRTEFGRAFTLGYAADRLSNFYYTDASILSGAGRLLARLLRVASGVPLREPWQSLYAIARRTSGTKSSPIK